VPRHAAIRPCAGAREQPINVVSGGLFEEHGAVDIFLLLFAPFLPWEIADFTDSEVTFGLQKFADSLTRFLGSCIEVPDLAGRLPRGTLAAAPEIGIFLDFMERGLPGGGERYMALGLAKPGPLPSAAGSVGEC